MKNDEKFEDELTYFKIDWRNLTDYDWSSRKSQIFAYLTLMGCFWPKYMFELKKCREIVCNDTEEWCKIWRGIDFPFQNWHKQFDSTTQKS